MKEPEDNPYIRDPDLEFRDVDELAESEAEEQVEQLREAVRFHDHRYYVENDPVVSDRVYDRLFSRLQELEKEFGLETATSPTQRVGGEPVDELETVEHTVEMLSLDASGEEEDVRAWADRVEQEVGGVEYHCEPKFDGLSVEIVYEDGEFSRAVTRGNGLEGDDISENVKTIRSVPLELEEAPEFLAVRGEIYMPRNGFQELNESRLREGKEPFANPRNAAAGTVRQLDPVVAAERPLEVFFYDVLDTSRSLGSQEEAVDLLEEAGFRVNGRRRVADSIDEFIDYRNETMELRDGLEYDVDGVVAKVNSYGKREDLGATARHPRWAYAYKFPAKKEETTVESVAVQVGRTGKLTPVALLEPVDVKGVTISRATLHNASQARELGVSGGARVKIERAGDVIPEVVEVLEPGEGEFEMPGSCPVCGSDVVQEDKYHFCTGGASCPAQLKRSLEHFASKNAMDIEGLGEKVADQLVDSGLVESIPDLYRLGKEDLVELERFGDRSAGNLVDEIDSSRDTTLSRFIYSLGIRHVGRETARKLADNFRLEELEEASLDELETVEDVGPEVAESIKSFFSGEGGDLVRELLEAGVDPERQEAGDELEGMKLVLTGSIRDYTRDELRSLLELHGAEVNSSVSGETDYLVVGDNPGETKLEDARKNNVEQMGEEEFREKVLSRVD